MMKFTDKIILWRLPLFCCLTGLLLRLIYLLSFAELPLCQFPCGPDIGEYIADMKNVLSPGGHQQPMIHGPLYGYFLALLNVICGNNLFAVRFLQSLLVLSAGLPVYAILKRKWNGDPLTPGLFLLLYSIYPPFIVWQCDFYSENLMLICCSWTLFTMECASKLKQYKHLLMFTAGLLCGCGILTHPMAAFFAAGIVVLYLIQWKNWRKTFLPTALFCAGTLLLLAPVSINRSIRAGKPVLIQQNSGFNIYLGNHASANGTCKVPPGDEWNRIHHQAEQSPGGSDPYFLSRTVDFICTQPLQWGVLLLKKAAMTFSAKELTTWSDITVLRKLFMHKLFYCSFPPIGICAFAGLFFLLRDRRKRIKFRFFLTLFFSFYAAQIILLTSGRYRIMCVFMMLVFAAALPRLLKEKFKLVQNPGKRIAYLLLPLLCGTILVFLPLHQPDINAEKRVAAFILAESWNLSGAKETAEQTLLAIPQEERNRQASILNMLGSIQMDLGKFAEAEKNLRLAHKVYPEYPNPLLNLGKLSEEKNPRAAVTYYLAALKYATPQTAEILLFNLGVLYQKHGNLRKAEDYYRELLKRNPASILPCRNLAILLLNKNDLSGAETLLRKAWLAEKNNPERIIDLAYVLLTAGKKEQAKELLRELLRKDPANQQAKELWNSVEPQSRK